MTPLPWFRVYANDLLTDRKMKRICKRTGQSKALVLGVWITLLCLANDSPNRGHLNIAADMPYTVEDLEDETGLPTEVLAQILDEFRAHGMINGKSTIQISNWDKRQYKSDNSTERVQKYRRKERFNVTFQERSSNALDTDTESDTDTEQNKNTLAFSARDVLPLLSRTANMMAFPSDQTDRVGQIVELVEGYGLERVEAAIKSAYKKWINTPRKDGRGNYSNTNLGFINWAQEELAASPADLRQKNPKDMTQEEWEAYLVTLGEQA